MKIRIHCAAMLAAAALVTLPCVSRAGLLHEWKLDETGGSIALDSITAANSAIGGTSNWTSGKINNAFKTTGSNLGYVNAGNVAVDGSFSLSFWVKPEDVSLDWRNMVSKQDGSNGNKSFWVGQNQIDGSVRFGMYFDGTTEVTIDTPASVISAGNWSLVTASWNESTKTQSIYVDGVLRNSAVRSGASFSASRSSNLLFNTNSTSATAGLGTGSWARFPGTLDDVGVWDSAFTPGEAKALFSMPATSGLSGYDAQAFDALRHAYQTNFTTQVGNVRWSRATGLTIGEGTVQRRPNGYAMQLDSAGVGVTALSTVGLSYDPQHINLADTTSGNENPGAAGADDPAIHIFGDGTSEIDGLTSNSSIGSADVRPDHAIAGSVLVMLWLQDTQGADDRAALRSELSGAGGTNYSLLDASDPQWARLSQMYSGFDTLIRFDDATLVGAVNWDFATHTDILVDQLAISTVPEPTSVGLIALCGLFAARRVRRSHD